MPATNYRARRERCYELLTKAVAEKGRLPYYKKNQKYAKMMIFMYESLTEMANNKNLQNGDCVLYKINFLNICYNSKTTQRTEKVIFEYAITGKSCRLKCFEIQHCSREDFIITLETFAAYYGLTLSKGNFKYTNPEEENKYVIRIPFEEAKEI